ncbi:carboxypeptidase-like regulatory domain-containing protein [Spirosoma soli]
MSRQSKLSSIATRGVFLTLFLANSVRIYAQSDYTIQGQVVDAKTGKPVPFVTLSVAEGKISNETNADGYFMLDLPKQLKQDTLTLTAINYRLTQMPLSTLPATHAVVQLAPVSYQAQASILDTYFSLERSFQARDTLLKAVAVIAKNYTNEPTLLHGFYRETIEKQQPNVCVSYTEGLIDVYKPSYYFTKKDDQIRFIKGRRKPLTTFTVPVLTPGPWVSNMLDIVKYQEFLFRNGKLNKDYVFELAGQTLIGDQPVYIINFKPRTFYVTTGYFAGKLFIAAESLAIVRAEYKLTEKGLAIVNKSKYAQVYSTKLQNRDYTVSYTKFDNRWSFQGGSVENTFTYTASDFPFRSRVDFVITQRQSENVKPFKATEQATYTKLPMQSFDATNNAFWNGENYLMPSLPYPTLVITSHSKP